MSFKIKMGIPEVLNYWNALQNQYKNGTISKKDEMVEYIVKNGMMTDLSVLQEAPFNLRGSVYDLFNEDMATFAGIRQVIESINETAKIG